MERSRDARQSVEFSAKTVEDALQQAAEEFGVPVQDLDYELVRDSTRTILGLVRTGQVTIRAYLPTIAQKAASEPSFGESEAKYVESASAEVDKDTVDEAEHRVDTELKQISPKLEEVVGEVVSTLLDKMGILAAVEVVDRGGVVDAERNEVSPLILNIVGDDLDILIGRRGETLRDLQFISRLIVSRRQGEWPNVVIDVEGYKAKRADTLSALALRMADQVRRTGRRVVLEPMPANERRIVHLALRDTEDVYTESTGEDDRRKVQIIPR